MRTRMGRVALALVLCVAAWAHARTVRAEEMVPCERRLPRNTLAYISLRNVADFKRAWSQTVYGQLERDESLADFRDDFRKRIDELSQELEDQIGLGLSELLAIPHGEIAAALVPVPEDKLGAVLFLDFGEHKESIEKLLARAAESLERDRARRTEDEIDDAHVVTFQFERSGDDDEDHPHADLLPTFSNPGYFLKDSCLVLGSDLAALKAVLSRWDGKLDESLAENEVFRYIVDRCRDQSDVPSHFVWFFDPLGAIRAFTALDARRVAHLDQGLAMLRNLGIDKFRGIGGTFDIARGDYDSVSRTLIYVEPPSKGILDLLQFDLSAQSPPKWLSSEWSGFTSVNWSLARAYTVVEATVDLVQGPGFLAQMVQNFADNDHFGKIHLKKDIFDQLPGPIHVVEADAPEGHAEAGQILVAAAVKNPAAFRGTLGKLARLGRGALKIEEREFQGEMIYDIEMPPVPVAMDIDEDQDDEEDEPVAAPRHLGVAVADNHLMFASDVRLLERVLRGVGEGQALADSPSYLRIARKFPPQTASIGYARQEAQFKMLYDLLKSGNADLLVGGLGQFDFSRLPALEALKKYAPESGSFMEIDERGLRITSFSLRKEGD